MDIFLQSSRTSERGLFCLNHFGEWFREGMDRPRFRIREIPFAELTRWSFCPDTGNLRHDTGRFFSIEGISVKTDFGPVPHWEQPIINQPEVGILGILVKKFDGVLHFLMQAKMEPGNLNMIQLAPTLQATRSNYTRAHQGSSPPLLSYFMERDQRNVLVDVLQSEQGGRFLRKRNRNIIIEIPEDGEVPVSPDYIWLTLGQIHQLMQRDNVINMDARTVLSCVPYKREASECSQGAMHSEDEILSWLTEMKCRFDLNVEKISLSQVRKWKKDDRRIYHEEGKFFEVIAVEVEADNREVPAWTQPLIRPCRDGIIAFIVRYFHGVLHFLIQAKVEAGNFDVLEMAPTVQCLTGSYKHAPMEKRPAFLDYVLQARPQQILLDTMQSEEGGRFFREENRNMILLADNRLPERIPDNYKWISYNQLKRLIRFNNFVNIQCRCLLSTLAPDQAYE